MLDRILQSVVHMFTEVLMNVQSAMFMNSTFNWFHQKYFWIDLCYDKVWGLVMTGLADVYRFKSCIQKYNLAIYHCGDCYVSATFLGLG